MKKIIPTLCISMLGLAAIGSASYAWFSMNTNVSVTGMQVKAQVGANLTIAEDAAGTTEVKTAFDNAYIKGHTEAATLEPVSTVNGKDFFYTSGTNVQASGDAIQDKYIAYEAAAFNTNYGTTDAVGYVDYVFQLKADNRQQEDERTVYLDMARLTYGADDAIGSKAFRSAFFVEDMGYTDADGIDHKESSAADLTAVDPTSIISAGGAYFTSGKAVNSTTTLDSVVNLDQDVSISPAVAAGEIHYYKVTVRLWLEGEDTSCKNDVFAALTDTWAFDLHFTMSKTADAAPINAMSAVATSAKTDLTSATISSDATKDMIVNGETYHELSVAGFYVKDGTSTLVGAAIYTIDAAGNVYDVTNACTLPSA